MQSAEGCCKYNYCTLSPPSILVTWFVRHAPHAASRELLQVCGCSDCAPWMNGQEASVWPLRRCLVAWFGGGARLCLVSPSPVFIDLVIVVAESRARLFVPPASLTPRARSTGTRSTSRDVPGPSRNLPDAAALLPPALV